MPINIGNMKAGDDAAAAALKNGVLRHRIRLWAHTLDRIMQTDDEVDKVRKAVGRNDGLLNMLESALELWKINYGALKLDVAWAEHIAGKYSSYMESGVCKWDPPIKPSSVDEINTLEKIIRERRSIRVWKDEQIPEGLLNKVLEAGLWAPSGCNAQPVRYCIVAGSEAKEYISRATGVGFLAKAPVIIVVGADIRGTSEVAWTEGANLNTGAAVQNMLLMAHSLGLGACWFFKVALKSEEFTAYFNTPPYLRLTALVALGWPLFSPTAPDRMGLDETVFHEKY